MSGPSPRAPGDHYSSIAAAYVAFRPRYTRELFEYVASLASSRKRAWDCGAGSGQATIDLAEFFDEVSGPSPRAPGDHYSSIAAAYVAFRPRYTRELFEYVASLAPSRRRAWDCGAGSGQATIDLAEFFDEVIGTDVSAEQLARAPKHARVRWVAAAAEQVPIEDGSVDLVTIAQALHWFDHDRFYAEVRRVCVPGAAIAAWTYAAPTMEGEVGRVLKRFMFEDVGAYWPPERKYVDERYESIPFPFERIRTPQFVLRHEWPIEQVIGYLRSMSATARFIAAVGRDPVIDVARELSAAWPRGVGALTIEWPLILIAGRV